MPSNAWRLARRRALSAALLWHAARGECIDEVAALAAALNGRGDPDAAVERLLAVGHTSGAALAHGVLVAAESSEPRGRGAVWTEERFLRRGKAAPNSALEGERENTA